MRHKKMSSTAATNTKTSATIWLISVMTIAVNVGQVSSSGLLLSQQQQQQQLQSDVSHQFTCGKLYYRTFHLDQQRNVLYVGAM